MEDGRWKIENIKDKRRKVEENAGSDQNFV
jgi:hypothetical protein